MNDLPPPTVAGGPPDVRGFASRVFASLVSSWRAAVALSREAESAGPGCDTWATLAVQARMDCESNLLRAVLCTDPAVDDLHVFHLPRIASRPRAVWFGGSLFAAVPDPGRELPEGRRTADGTHAMSLAVIDPADVVRIGGRS